jgi:hypothetical protein
MCLLLGAAARIPVRRARRGLANFSCIHQHACQSTIRDLNSCPREELKGGEGEGQIHAATHHVPACERTEQMGRDFAG